MTQFVSTPRPLLTAWGGPVLGVLIGAGIPALIARFSRPARAPMLLIAGFVLLANGLYIGLGAVMPVGDARSMLMFGSARWQLALFGIAGVVSGRILLGQAWRDRQQAHLWGSTLVSIMGFVVLAVVGLVFFSETPAAS